MSSVNIVKDTTGPSDQVVLKCGDSICGVYLFGATVFSWKPDGFDEKLWIAKQSIMDGVTPVRGGIPISFPQFAGQGTLPSHGLVRQAMWELQSSNVNSNNNNSGDSATAVLKLCDSEVTRKSWNHSFVLLYTVTLTKLTLTVTLSIENTNNTDEFDFTACLHTYFKTANIRNCSISGLQNLSYFDKCNQIPNNIQTDEFLVIDDSVTTLDPNNYIDRTYSNVNSDTSGSRRVSLIDSNSKGNNSQGCKVVLDISNSFINTVVWNPWVEGKKGSKGPDFDDDGYNTMVCIEPVVSTTPITLKPGDKWEGSKVMTISQVTV